MGEQQPIVTKERNCRVKTDCPLEGNCLDKSVIYKCHVKANENDDGIHYIRLTEGTFKKRWYNHCHDFRNESKEKSNGTKDLGSKERGKCANFEMGNH